jgi:hypothetical protein
MSRQTQVRDHHLGLHTGSTPPSGHRGTRGRSRGRVWAAARERGGAQRHDCALIRAGWCGRSANVGVDIFVLPTDMDAARQGWTLGAFQVGRQDEGQRNVVGVAQVLQAASEDFAGEMVRTGTHSDEGLDGLVGEGHLAVQAVS